jgi:glycosyltransferase involved in cell wall biosynthesis
MKRDKEIRIIVLFGSPFLYGSEKANIDVFTSLKEYKIIRTLFLIDEKRGGNFITDYLKKRNLDYKPVNYHFMFSKKMNIFQYIIKLYEIFSGSIQFLIEVVKFKPTHIYTSKPEYFLNFLPILLFLKTPIIYRIGDSPVVHNFVYRKLWEYICGKSKMFVCVSKFIEKQVQETVSNDVKSTVIYSRPHDNINILKKTKENKNNFNALYVGQIGAHKGVSLFIDAAIKLCAKYENISFNIAGKINKNDKFTSNLISKINKSNYSKKIKLLGFVTNVNDLYQSADIHVCPSVYEEPLANVLIDAKQNKVPSIIFNVGGLPEVITNNVDGIICDNITEKDLYLAIESCFINRNLTKEMGFNAKDSLTKLDVNNFKTNWLNIFKHSMS